MPLVRALSIGLVVLGVAALWLWHSRADDAWRVSAAFSWLLGCIVSGFLACAHAWRMKLREDGVPPELATMERFDARLLGRLDAPPPRLGDEWVRCIVAGMAWSAVGLAGLAVFYYGHLSIAFG